MSELSQSSFRTFTLLATLAAATLTLTQCSGSPAPGAGTGAASPSMGADGGFLITHATLVDGTGAPAVAGTAVRVRDGRILEVGKLTPVEGEAVIDAGGKVLAPGFIDTHSHHDRGLDRMRDAKAAVGQGITTIVVGQDGDRKSVV